MELYRICFRSKIEWANVSPELQKELDYSLTRIRRMNRRKGVTGALLMGNTHVLHYLEGQPGPVLDTLYCVMQDTRVGEMEAIFHEPAPSRLFPNSLMLFRDLTSGEAVELHPALQFQIDRPTRLSYDEGLNALCCFSEEVRESRVINRMMLV
ncbi:BLUF domain-containing protein [Roseibium sediminis]|uniref:BLUF domain-containing protein n=1 Tax=Roseibium sediminis TaxID=1775174 RepID=UPI00123C9C2F|nr:BLUF domain-containing protein [Roseibium sediminis]